MKRILISLQFIAKGPVENNPLLVPKQAEG